MGFPDKNTGVDCHSSSRASFRPWDQTQVSCVPCTAGGFFTVWAIREAPDFIYIFLFLISKRSSLLPECSFFWCHILIWWVHILVLRLLIRGYLMVSSTCTVSLFSKLPFSIHFGLCNSCERHPQCLGNVHCLFLFKMGGGEGRGGGSGWRAEWKVWTCKGFVSRSSTVRSSRAVWLEDAHISSVQSLSHVQLFVTPWTVARQASLSFTISQSLPKLMFTESVMSSNHLILCYPLLLLPSIFPSIRVFSNESVLRIMWTKYWSFGFSISPSSE